MNENDKPRKRGRPQKPGNKRRTAFTVSESGYQMLAEIGRDYGLTISQMLEVIIRDRYRDEQAWKMKMASERKRPPHMTD